ncbi:MAG: hypothetical protein JXP34_03335 [Planctomycetes bacterium]|nr:hypothetical protein [Planctomycetota bacterium]
MGRFFILALVMAFGLAFAGSAWAADAVGNGDQDRTQAQDGTCVEPGDSDGDGIPDGDGPDATRDQDRDRDGTCCEDGTCDPTCPNYVDEDGDGICDNCPAGAGDGDGEGMGPHDGAGDGIHNRGCPAFVDEDGDGICDLCNKPDAPQQEGETGSRRQRFIRGDLNRDRVRDIGDAICALDGLFSGRGFGCEDEADVNDDGALTIADPIDLLEELFGDRGRPIPPPCLNEGEDPTEDDLTCEG